ncbi:MAG: DNA primase [Planctomycetes bacterium]|nr:DNA primase [Planctomycetota bacterium]
MDRFEDAKLRIKEATDLVALIESYLPLKARGRDLIALCPFHAERSPSFTVSRSGQFFYCFGCGKTGDVFSWLQEREGLSFREAMEVLADRAGISLEGVFSSGQKTRKGPDPYAVLGEVAGFFQRCLGSDEGVLAREYLERRGLDAAIVPWRLGVHPRPGALQRFVADKKLPREILEQAGLFKNGRDPYAHRLMFPIEDERGRTVAFGARIVPGAPGSDAEGDRKPPKYLNSPESPWFNKRRVLFGLSRAKQAGARKLVVMEGYTDVIACHLAGFTGAVASLGTSFTRDHARTVERYATEGVVLMFDGDRAGRQAAERALRELVNSRLAVRIAIVGDGDAAAKDPADLVAERPGDDPETVAVRREGFRELLDHAEDDLTVWFRLLRQRLDLSQAVNVEAAARECADILALCEEPVRRAAMTEAMARHLALPPQALERLLQKIGRRAARPATDEPGIDDGGPPEGEADGDGGDRRAAPRSLTAKAEVEIGACIVADPGLLADFDVEAAEPFEVEGLRELLDLAFEGVARGRTSRGDLLKFLFARVAEQPVLRRLLGEIATRAETISTPGPVLVGHLEGRRRLSEEPRRRVLRQQLQAALAAGDQVAAAELQRQWLESKRRERPRPAAEPVPEERAADAPAADAAAGATDDHRADEASQTVPPLTPPVADEAADGSD